MSISVVYLISSAIPHEFLTVMADPELPLYEPATGPPPYHSFPQVPYIF